MSSASPSQGRFRPFRIAHFALLDVKTRCLVVSLDKTIVRSTVQHKTKRSVPPRRKWNQPPRPPVQCCGRGRPGHWSKRTKVDQAVRQNRRLPPTLGRGAGGTAISFEVKTPTPERRFLVSSIVLTSNGNDGNAFDHLLCKKFPQTFCLTRNQRSHIFRFPEGALLEKTCNPKSIDFFLSRIAEKA